MAILLFLLMVLVGCSKAESKTVKEDSLAIIGETYPLRVIDAINQETELEKKPQKVAVLSGTPLNIWYDLGGQSICTSDVSENLKILEGYEEEIRNLPAIGPVYSVDMETIISMDPDLIIAQLGTQTLHAQRLRDMGYNVITTHIRSYEDVLNAYRIFGKVLEAESLADEKINMMDEKINAITSRLPDENTSVVILYVTSQSLAVKLDNSIAGDVASTLGLNNIASDLPPDTIGSENTPIDIEYIVGKNPDYVLVTSMVSSNELAIEMMNKEFMTNPAWQGVSAITEGKVIYLPQQYFLYNAGPYYHEAVEYMAREIYPEIYNDKLEN